jgi:hypothetical protein
LTNLEKLTLKFYEKLFLKDGDEDMIVDSILKLTNLTSLNIRLDHKSNILVIKNRFDDIVNLTTLTTIKVTIR